ncbi:hypothetical protein [Marinoscillum sp. MHG1-6]|uniref:hypothetical protein n=1 Tax=Marinoscillum sp. MHG1-6 TaxID=2959627 RepID=UPI0021585121|nr:hypothetical protein [Marinoscillum sp. MHG1-6]
MNTLKKLSMLALGLTLFSFASLANGYDFDDPNSKIVQKAIDAVANAEDNDWETLAQSAEICFMKKENMEEAVTWIEHSIKIKETPYNMEVYGDYLASVGKNKEARRHYYNAIVLIKQKEPTSENTRLQQKIWDLR